MEETVFDKPPRPIWALILCCLLVVVCYFFVDRPVALFMHEHRFLPEQFLAYPQQLSSWLGNCVVVGIVGIIVWRVWRPGGATQTLLLAIAANLLATFAIKSLLKSAFGRTWPETWLNDNPSFIADGAYGFHPFQFDAAYQSFPSGHAAATFAVVSILWLSRPRWRWLYGLVGGAVCAALVGLNYHFVSDVLAGAMLGGITGFFATRVFRLRIT